MEITTGDNLPLLAVTGAAAILGCSAQTVLNLTARGELPYFRDSARRRLFRQADLDVLRRKRSRQLKRAS